MFLYDTVIRSKAFFEKKCNLLICVGLISFCWTYLAIWVNPIVNTDGIVYLKSAEVFLSDGFQATMTIHDLPFYPILIAGLSTLSSLSIIQSAYLLNALLMAFTAVAVVKIVENYDQRLSTLFLISALLLLHPELNSYRYAVLRDFGYWCFSCWALLFFIRAYDQKDLFTLLISSTLIMIACLFRPEAAIFLLINAVFLVRWLNKQLSRGWLRWLMLLVSLIIAFGLGWLLIRYMHTRLDNLNVFYQNFSAVLAKFSDDILRGSSEDLAPWSLLIAFFSLTLLKILKNFGIVYIIAALYLISQRQRFKPQYRALISLSPLYLYGAAALMVLFIYVCLSQFLQGRFTILICLLGFIPLSLWLGAWVQQFKEISDNKEIRDNEETSDNKDIGSIKAIDKNTPPSLDKKQKKTIANRKVVYIMILVGLALFIDSFISFGSSKTYLMASANYLAEFDSQTTLLTNSKRIAYFSTLSYQWDQVQGQNSFDKSLNQTLARRFDQQNNRYDLLAILHSRKDDELIKRIDQGIDDYQIIKIFENEKRDRVVIFAHQKLIELNNTIEPLQRLNPESKNN